MLNGEVFIVCLLSNVFMRSQMGVDLQIITKSDIVLIVNIDTNGWLNIKGKTSKKKEVLNNEFRNGFAGA
jgi:hypothetical protein